MSHSGGVAADAFYGVGGHRDDLAPCRQGLRTCVKSDHAFHFWDKRDCVSGTAATIAEALPVKAWQRLPAGEGTKGCTIVYT